MTRRMWLMVAAAVAVIATAAWASDLSLKNLRTQFVDWKLLSTPPALSESGECRTYFDSGAAAMKTSCDGGAYSAAGQYDLSPGTPGADCGGTIVGGNTAGTLLAVNGSAFSCTISFSATQAFTPTCVIMAANATLGAVGTSSRAITLTFAAAGPGTVSFSWICTKPR